MKDTNSIESIISMLEKKSYKAEDIPLTTCSHCKEKTPLHFRKCLSKECVSRREKKKP